MPMQPRPRAETTGPPRPSFRCCITKDSQKETKVTKSQTGRIVPQLQLRLLRYLLLKSLDLSDPDTRRVFFPAMSNCRKLRLTQRSRLEQSGILLPAFRYCRTDNGGVHTGNAEREPQRDANRSFQVGVTQKFVIQFPQSLPVLVMIPLDRFVSCLPGRVCNRPLGDYAHLFFVRQGHGQLNRFLVGDADGGLQRIERATFHGVVRRATVAAVADVTPVTVFACRLQRCYCFAFSHF